jgi:uncharacterized protein YcfL
MKLITLVSLAALTLVACDSKQEQARKAELDAQAAKLDEAAKTARKNGEIDAKVTKKEGEAKAEALKDEANRVREQKNNN